MQTDERTCYQFDRCVHCTPAQLTLWRAAESISPRRQSDIEPQSTAGGRWQSAAPVIIIKLLVYIFGRNINF